MCDFDRVCSFLALSSKLVEYAVRYFIEKLDPGAQNRGTKISGQMRHTKERTKGCTKEGIIERTCFVCISFRFVSISFA